MAFVRLEKCLVPLKTSQVGTALQLCAALPDLSEVAGMYLALMCLPLGAATQVCLGSVSCAAAESVRHLIDDAQWRSALLCTHLPHV